MIPRQCDNDACDYETDNGRLRWYHAPGCNPMSGVGPEELNQAIRTAHPDSLLAHLARAKRAAR